MPDDLFQRAEVTARRLRVSRSELYAHAIEEFLQRKDDSAVTEALNAVYSRQPAALDTGLQRAQLKYLKKVPWQK